MLKLSKCVNKPLYNRIHTYRHTPTHIAPLQTASRRNLVLFIPLKKGYTNFLQVSRREMRGMYIHMYVCIFNRAQDHSLSVCKDFPITVKGIVQSGIFDWSYRLFSIINFFFGVFSPRTMSNLRICKAMSLHPSANLALNVDVNVAAAVHNKADADASNSSSTRICLMGCMATAAELRRFPVHDANRWVRKFIISFISFSFTVDLHIDILTHAHTV